VHRAALIWLGEAKLEGQDQPVAVFGATDAAGT
jgi:hypothetical protein